MATAVKPKRSLDETLRPYRVIAGLVLSFSLVTLVGTALLSLLHLPQDAIRWAALVALVAIGLGLIFPRFEQILEKPFSRIPQIQVGQGKSGFGLGLALGVLYVPCAGPVLAAIVVAGATGSIGLSTVALTVSFAIGAALPLLFFALAGQRVAERVGAFRRHQRRIRMIGGIVMIVLAVALVFNVPAMLQRAIPDYTGGLQDRVVASDEIQEKLNLGGLVNDQNRELSNCTNGASELESCGTAPDIKGIDGWLNTPGGAPIDLKSLRGKVVLIDFWAYSCINCQRAIPHVVDWYDKYKDCGPGGHRGAHPRVRVREGPEQRRQRRRRSGHHLPDRAGQQPLDVDELPQPLLARRVSDRRERDRAAHQVRRGRLRRHREPDQATALRRQSRRRIAAPSESVDTTPTSGQTPETYFGVGKMVNYGGTDVYDEGTADFNYPANLADDSFAYRGRWKLDYQGATAESDDSTIALNYNAKNVYIVAGGEGTVTVTRDGKTTTVPISGPPQSRQIVADDEVERGQLEVRLSKGLQAFSFTYG